MNTFITVCAVAFAASASLVVAAESKDTRCYELRVYYAAPGSSTTSMPASATTR
jgi:hypothetical protein